MSVKPNRQFFGALLWAARIAGWIVIAVAILGLPQMRNLTGRLAPSLGLIMSVTLALAGAAWLLAVRVFLHFFDRYLSRN
jgi:hypothetical protein